MALAGYQFLFSLHLDTTALGAGTQNNFIVPLTEKSFNSAVVDLIMGGCEKTGFDFRVTDDGGSSFLPYELVSWDFENKTFEVHFKTTADIYNVAIDFDLYGGKPDAVDETSNLWANFDGVFHLGESSSPSINSVNAAQPAAWSGNVAQADAVIGKGAWLDGGGDYIGINNESVYDYEFGITVEAWFRIDAFTNDWQALVVKGDGAWRLHRDDGNNGIALTCTGVSTTTVKTTSPVNNGRWHHVAGVYDNTSGTMKIYLDGVKEGENTSLTGDISLSNDDPKIGRNVDRTGRDWQGWVDDVRIGANTSNWYTDAWAKLTYELGANPLSYFSTPSLDVIGLGWHRKAKIDTDISAQVSTGVTDMAIPYRLTGAQYPELFAGKYKAMPDGSDLVALPTGETDIDELLNMDLITFENPTVDEGTTDSTTANKLVDSTQNFLTTAAIDDIIWRKRDDALALVTAVDSDTTLSLDSDIILSGDDYLIIRGLAAFYVRQPLDLDTAERSIDLYWSRGGSTRQGRDSIIGGSELTWDDDFTLVSHLQQPSVQDAVDSTIWDATGEVANTPQQAAGKFAKYSQDLEEGSNERFRFPNNDARYGIANGFTFSGWVNAGNLSSNHTFLGRRDGSNEGMELMLSSANRLRAIFGGSTNQTDYEGDTALITATWYFVQFVYNGAFPVDPKPWGVLKMWVDGTLQSNTEGGNVFTAFTDPNKRLSIGSRNGDSTDNDYDGLIESFKWSPIERSDDWLKAEGLLMLDATNNKSATYYTFNTSVAVGNVAYTSGWNYELELAVGNAYSETLYIARLTEAVSSIPSAIFTQARTDGSDIRVTQSGAYVPIHLVRFDRVNERLQLMAEINPQLPYTLTWGSSNYERNFVIDSGFGQFEAYDAFYLAFWHGEEESGAVAYDSTRKQLHGEYVGTMPQFQSSDSETVQSFNGTSDGAKIPDDDILDMIVGVPFILETMVKFKTVDQTIVRELICKQQDGVGRWELQLNGGRDPQDKDGLLRFSLRGGAISERIHSNEVAEAGVWYHIVGIRDASGNCTLYINGVLQNETLLFNYDLSNAADVSIGYKPYGSAQEYADVYIEETRITKYSSRSDDYIKMTDENFRKPDDFYGLAVQNNLRGNLKTNLLGGFQ